jgi:hypothetical protein
MGLFPSEKIMAYVTAPWQIIVMSQPPCRPRIQNQSRQKLNYVGFEVLTAVVRKSSVFWAIMYCSLVKVRS